MGPGVLRPFRGSDTPEPRHRPGNRTLPASAHPSTRIHMAPMPWGLLGTVCQVPAGTQLYTPPPEPGNVNPI